MPKLKLFGRDRWFVVFLDLFVFVTLVCVARHFGVHLSQRDKTFNFIILLGASFLFYPKSKIDFSYYSQPVKVVICVLLVLIAHYLIIRRADLVVSLCWIFVVWFVLVEAFRYVLMRWALEKVLYFNLSGILLPLHPKFELISPQKHGVHVDLGSFDAIIVDRHRDYTEEEKQFLTHCQIVGKPVVLQEFFEELSLQQVSVAALHQSWADTSFYINDWYLLAKRLVDLGLTLLLLPALVVLMLLVSVLILISMGHPVVFVQERVGRDEKRFKLYKFRTMCLHEAGGETRVGDSRITVLGHFLRKFRLDEFPQFWNILKGDMSLIGPRPEWIATAEQFKNDIPLYHLRSLVRPGITGWAQVLQGHTTGVEGNYQKLQYDLYYIKHLSFWLDMRILAKTMLTLLSRSGAK